MLINLTPTSVIESTIMYGIVHGIWSISKMVVNRFGKEVREERDRIIHRHVKAGHECRLRECSDLICASLRMPGLVPQEYLEQPELLEPRKE